MADLLEHVHRHGLGEPMVAARALLSTVRVLAERLPDAEAAALARSLPPELQRLVEEAEYDVDFDAGEAYRRMALGVGVGVAIATEDARAQSDIVMRALGEILGGDLVTRLERVLPERLTRALRPVDHEAVSPFRSSGLRRTVTGHPGSHHLAR